MSARKRHLTDATAAGEINRLTALVIFFFSSRRRHTRFDCDWSSDVCSSDLSVPAGNLREFVTLLQKDRSLKYNYGSTGPGSYMNIVGEVMKRDEKIEMAHIPLKGAAPLKQEPLAGRLQLRGHQLSSSLAAIQQGSLQ